MSKDLDLSIILVNWNTKQITLDCLDSVYRQTSQHSFEIIVVDNDSSDDSVEAIKDAYPSAKLIESRVNLGFAKGNNVAIKQARGRYIVLLNTDTIVLDSALDAVVTYLDEHPQVGAATPRLVGRDGLTQFAAAKDPTLWGYTNEYLFHRYPDLYNTSAYERDMEVDIIPGACFFIRRQVIDTVGGLPEIYFMYVEDVEWCQQIRQAGWKIMYLAGPQVIHFGGESSKQAQVKMNKQLIQSRLQHFREHKGWFQAMLLQIVLIGHYARRSIALRWRSLYAKA